MTTSHSHDHGWGAAMHATNYGLTGMNEALTKWKASFPERGDQPTEVEAWIQGWQERASWVTNAADWAQLAAEFAYTEYGTDPELFLKVREYIRNYDGGTRWHGRSVVVSADEILADCEGLIPTDTREVLALFYDLWDDPNIERVNSDHIEFVYNDTPRTR